MLMVATIWTFLGLCARCISPSSLGAKLVHVHLPSVRTLRALSQTFDNFLSCWRCKLRWNIVDEAQTTRTCVRSLTDV